MPCTPPWIWRRSIWNWPETAREPLPAKPRRTAAACKPTENTSDKRHPDGCLFLFARADFRVEASGNRGFAPPGRTALRSRQSTSPRQSRRFFHIRSSPSRMAQAALLSPYYSSFPGDCNGRRLGMQTGTPGSFRVRVNHHSPQAGNAVRKLSHAAAGFMENPDADAHRLLYPVRAGDPFHYKKGPAENPCGALFYHCFWLRESGGTQTARPLSPNGTRLQTSGRSTGWTGSPGHAPPSGRQGSPPHQTAPPCRTG